MVKKKAAPIKSSKKKVSGKPSKAPARKEKPKTKARQKAVSKPKPVLKPAKAARPVSAPVAAPVPSRAPVRRVMRDDRSIVVVADRVDPEKVVSVSMVLDAPPVVGNTALESVELKALQVKTPQPVVRPEVVLPKQAPVAWNNLPLSYPVQSRFYLSMAEKECRAAASWPFPFARFVAALPEEMCGKGMALLLLALEVPVKGISELLGESEAVIEARLERERGELLERCNAHCPEMFRKMKTQIGGSGLSIEALIEKYLVSRVDRNFQLTIGAIVLQALRA